MHGNGASVCAHLEARVHELEIAIAILARRYEGELVARLLSIEEEVAGQREALTGLAASIRCLADDDDNDRGRRR
jgi:uncharacterized coiled-coil protein SlyX